MVIVVLVVKVTRQRIKDGYGMGIIYISQCHSKRQHVFRVKNIIQHKKRVTNVA